MERVSFTAFELHADGSLREASYAFEGGKRDGWIISREGRVNLELPAGYDLLPVSACGICSTDQARPFLPFPLPQIIGHEVVARDGSGRPAAAEINASHAALGSSEAAACPLCRRGLPTHCPGRPVLGIDRLPGGFGPFILVPEKNIVPIPATLPLETAVLVEPFAAALHAAETIDLDRAASVAVVGTGKLGLLVIAALGAIRDERGLGFSIMAMERNKKRADLALRLGADRLLDGGRDAVDAAVECTGSPEGLTAALSLARREVHVKSTTGREAIGFRHLTEMVVDEISLGVFSRTALERLAASGARTVLLIGDRLPPGAAAEVESLGLAARHLTPASPFNGESWDAADQADAAVVSSLRSTERALRPWPDRQQGLVRPGGTILAAGKQSAHRDLFGLLLSRRLLITTSRCGDFRQALPRLEELLRKGIALGEIMVTHRFPVRNLPAAMAAAGRSDAVKVMVEH